MRDDDFAEVSVAAAMAFGEKVTVEVDQQLGGIVADLYVTPAAAMRGGDVFVAKYGPDRELIVTWSTHGGASQTHVRLGEFVGYDSHADVVLGIDADGLLHLCANMHSSPLVYFRSSHAGDPLGSLERIETMVSSELETRMTYPRFFRGPEGALWFAFRAGTSGDGEQKLYRWNQVATAWEDVLPQSVVAGAGMSPYLDAYRPIQGPDGNFHLVWVWRDLPDAETNHTVCYARSTDLLNWESAGGESLEPPMSSVGELVVDPAGVGSGLLNNNCRLAFTGEGLPVVIYHRYVDTGKLRLHFAVFLGGEWIITRWDGWTVDWYFEGRGTLDFQLEIGAATPLVGGVRVAAQDRTHLRLIDVKIGSSGAYVDRDEVIGLSASARAAEVGWWCRRVSGSEDLVLVWRSDRPRRDQRPSSIEATAANELTLMRRIRQQHAISASECVV